MHRLLAVTHNLCGSVRLHYKQWPSPSSNEAEKYNRNRKQGPIFLQNKRFSFGEKLARALRLRTKPCRFPLLFQFELHLHEFYYFLASS